MFPLGRISSLFLFCCRLFLFLFLFLFFFSFFVSFCCVLIEFHFSGGSTTLSADFIRVSFVGDGHCIMAPRSHWMAEFHHVCLICSYIGLI